MKRIFLTLTFILFVIPFGISQDIILNGSVSVENNQIKNVGEPTENKDVTTKNYVDELIENQQINNGKVYVFRVDYDGEALSGSQGSITQITDSPYNSNSANTNKQTISQVEFQFPSEDEPPRSILIWAYNAQTQIYNVGYAPHSLTSLVSYLPIATPQFDGNTITSLIGNFGATKFRLNLTPSVIGAKTYTDFVRNENAHCYVMFWF